MRCHNDPKVSCSRLVPVRLGAPLRVAPSKPAYRPSERFA